MERIGKEQLRLVISVALGLAPRRIKKAFADRFDPQTEDASRYLSTAVTEAVLRTHDVAEKDVPNVGAGAQYRGPAGDAGI